MEIKDILLKLPNKQDLLPREAKNIAKSMLKGELSPVQIASLLLLLKVKGEAPSEILQFILVMREHMVKIQERELVVDTCGTGGDRSGTFNISTAAAFVAAGAGVPVAKHGNRSASSKCGSADVLEALGVSIHMTPEQAHDLLAKTGFTFLFAPLYHQSMKHVAPIRKELQTPTIFNMLGPFLNPLGTKRQVIGVPDLPTAKKLSVVARKLGYQHLLLVTSADGLDEISIHAKTHAFEVKGARVRKITIDPEQFGFMPSSKKAMYGADAETNAEIIENILHGKKGVARDIVILNSAAVLYVAGKAETIKKGVSLAQHAVDSGRALGVLEHVRKETKQYGNT